MLGNLSHDDAVKPHNLKGGVNFGKYSVIENIHIISINIPDSYLCFKF